MGIFDRINHKKRQVWRLAARTIRHSGRFARASMIAKFENYPVGLLLRHWCREFHACGRFNAGEPEEARR
jgi:hypothetical protein